MKGGEWIWIMLALFGLFRLLLLAGKKKREEAPPPPRPQPRRPRPASGGDDGDVDQLKQFIDKLTDQFGVPPRPVPPGPRRQPAQRPLPPPPRYSDRSSRRPHGRKETVRRAPPVPATPPAAGPFEEMKPVPGPPRHTLREIMSYSDNPLVEGIIFSEILGPPRALRGSTMLPSDSRAICSGRSDHLT